VSHCVVSFVFIHSCFRFPHLDYVVDWLTAIGHEYAITKSLNLGQCRDRLCSAVSTQHLTMLAAHGNGNKLISHQMCSSIVLAQMISRCYYGVVLGCKLYDGDLREGDSMLKLAITEEQYNRPSHPEEVAASSRNGRHAERNLSTKTTGTTSSLF